MDSGTQEENAEYIRKYRIGGILRIIGTIPLFGYIGFLFYMEELLFTAEANSQQISTVNLKFMFSILEYFPILIIVMMVLMYAGRYLQMSSLENIVGKTRYEMSPIEYRRSAREIRMAIRNGKLDNVGKFKSTALESPEKVNGINSDENSPFSKK